MTRNSLHSPEPYRELEKYFERIVNTQPKELSMFEKTKMFFNEQLEKINTLLTKPVAFVEEDPKAMGTDYWAFEMYTGEWYSDERGELQPVKHTCIIEPHEGTWMEILDKVMDEMEKHYGYSIKEQVYYSVNFPLNELDNEGNPFPGYGRCLNDKRLQQVLLAFPELYESRPWSNNPTEEAMFK